MKYFIVVLVVASASILFSACPKKQIGDESASHNAAAEIYTCPMHPSVQSDRPSACPVCGMALVKKSAQSDLSPGEKSMLQTVSLSPAQRVVANIATVTAERRSFTRALSAVGVVDFAEPNRALVAARFRGRIEKLHVNFTGASVKKGQPLFDLYSPDLITAQQDYLLALEAKKQQSSNINDQLVETSRKRLQMHFGLTQQQIAEMESTRKFHHVATYFSPISGTVLSKQIQEGQFVDEGATLYQLADLSRVWVYLDVYEKDVASISLNQKVTIAAEAYANRTFPGRVAFIDAVVNADSRTIRVRTEIANPSGTLKPNMFVRGSFDVPESEGIVVPRTAVISTGRRNVVWVEVRANNFEPRTVTVSSMNDVDAFVTSGLEEGEKVVITGGYLIDSESQLSMPASQEVAHDQGSVEGDRGSGNKDRRSQTSAEETESDAVREIKINVEYAYSPEVIKVKKGKKIRLLFYRNEDSRCTDEVIFKDFGIKQKLPAFKTTTIEFTPKKAGSFDFSCGMEMVFGKLVVR